MNKQTNKKPELHTLAEKYLQGGDKKQKQTSEKTVKSPFRNFLQQLLIVIAIFGVLGIVYNATHRSKKETVEKQISFGELVTAIQSDTVTKVTVKNETITATMKDKTEKIAKRDIEIPVSEQLLQYGVSSDQLKRLSLELGAKSSTLLWTAIIGNIVLPVLGFLLILFFVGRMLSRTGGGAGGMSFGLSRARTVDETHKKVTFLDVAGNREAKTELSEIVDFLKKPEKYLEIGAKIPKGVLMTGAPGTGKTLLARAVAGEADVPFYFLSGSEFVEMFVGVGASRVRDLFETAKSNAPSIIFIDEIDAVGRKRGVGTGGGNDEREQTLNQILVEMDGFEPTQTVIVIAATNRAEVLDQALLRPGRFDRRVVLDLPDRRDRREILDIHSKGKKLASDIDLQKIAERTVGFSGADLDSLMNEAALLSARYDKTEISQKELILASERVMMGPERQSHIHTPRERELVAYHEAGHAVLASVLEHADPVHKVSIIARGHAGGYTMKLPLEDKKLTTRQEYLDDLAMSMAGGEAERIYLKGDFTTGPSGDIQQSTELARAMVTRWGMSDTVGPVAIDVHENGIFAGARPESDKTLETVDAEIRNLMLHAQQRARAKLSEYRPLLDAIVKKLLELETIDHAEFNQILRDNGIVPKEISQIEIPKPEMI
jgi:cell division protease FtsH